LVVVYHLWPGVLTGGYVGVDIFFVISGFLITGGLVTRPPKTWHDVADFWGRRIRRLLPASFLVIVATGVAAWLVGPPSAWVQTARDAVAAAVYVENWNLWHKSTDYLARGGVPSIFQHFWSLSVEEQFYVFWPVLMLAVVVLWHRKDHGGDTASVRLPITLVVGAAAGVSFALSVWMTIRNPAEAYLVTQTRVWELALGGLLACFWPRLEDRLAPHPTMRAGAVAVGLVAMIAAAVWFSDATPFPGWVALLPTAGAALFIVGGRAPTDLRPRAKAPELGNDKLGEHVSSLQVKPDIDPNGIDRFLKHFWSLRPIQYLGDMSYSVYLWHWPLMLLAPYVLGSELSLGTSALVILATLGLSAVSYAFVEQPFQRWRWIRSRPKRTFVPAVASMAVLGLVGSGVYVGVESTGMSEVASAREHVRQSQCLGAQRILDPTCAVTGTADEAGPYPDPRFGSLDQPTAFGDGCTRHWDDPSPHRCRYALPEESAKWEVVLWGNSHAVQWLPGLQRSARDLDLGITTWLSSACFPRAPGGKFDALTFRDECVDVTEEELDAIRAHEPDLVVLSNRVEAPPDKYDLAVESASWVLQQLTEAEMKVIVIRDNPREPAERSIPDCLALNADRIDRCSGPREDWLSPDPWVDAAAAFGPDLVEVLDFTDAICGREVCRGIVGSVVAYFDDDHLSATFVETLAPQLSAAVQGALAR
jgi:peptidoglycan/LPS O-acetylase OafA/YrhL